MSIAEWCQAYNDLSVSVYITDVETHEILFMNERLKSKLPNACLGGLCYREFCGFDTPCSHCIPKDQLPEADNSSFTQSKQRYNPILDRYLDIYERITDWDDGRKARLMIAIDVTESTREKQQLEMLNATFAIHQSDIESTAEWQRAILDNTSDYLACFDRNLRVRYCNLALAAITNWKVGDSATGKFLTPDGAKAVSDYALKAVLDGQPWSDNTQLLKTDGSRIPVFLRLFPIFDKEHNVNGIAVTMTDQTTQLALLDETSHKLRNQEFITKFSTPFTQPYEFDTLMNNALQELQRYLGTDRVGLYEFNDEGNLVCTFEARSQPDITPQLHFVYTYEATRPVFEFIDQYPYYYCHDARAFYARFPIIDQGAKSVCYIPVMAGGRRIGYMVFACLYQMAEWAEEEFRLVMMASSIIAGAYETHSNEQINRRTQERLELALEVSAIGVWEMSVSAQTISFDQGFKKLVQLETGSPMSMLDWADHLEKLIDLNSQANIDHLHYLRNFDCTQIIFLRNHTFTYADGSIKYMNASSRIYCDHAGKPERLVGMLWDVTDEVLQRRSEERAQTFMADFSAPFLRPYDFDTLINNALQELNRFFNSDRASIFLMEDDHYSCKFSCTVDESVPSIVDMTFPMSDIMELTEILRTAPYYYINDTRIPGVSSRDIRFGAKSVCYLPFATDGKLTGYLVLVRVNDWHNWADSMIRPAVMAASIIYGAILTHQGTVKLEKAQARLQMALSTSRMGVWEISVPEQTIDFDEGTAQLFRLTQQSPIPLKVFADHVSAFLDGTEYTDYINYMGNAYDGRRSRNNAKLKLTFPDGTVQYTTHSVKTICDAQGNPERIIGLTNDVTKDTLLLEQLEQTTQEAAEANKAKSNFLSRMSHELRTPLNAISGMAQLSQNSENPVELKEYLEKIQTASQQLLAIVNDVLDISKIESGKMELQIAPFELEPCIEKSCSMVAGNIFQKGLHFRYQCRNIKHFWFTGDELRISQILINLLSNAVKFTPDGGKIDLTMEEIPVDADKSMITLSVKDTGIGMTQEQQARVFNVFEQADITTTRRFGGTGLGLAICKNMVNKMGGTIHLESHPDVGSEFTVNLPLVLAPEQEEASRQRCREKASRLRILLGTRSEDTATPFRMLAEDFSWTLDVVDEIDNIVCDDLARAQAEGRPYDFVFMDSAVMTRFVESQENSDKKLRLPERTVCITEVGERHAAQGVAAKCGITKLIAKPLTCTGVLRFTCQLMEHGTTTAMRPHKEADLSKLRVLLTEDIEINRMIALTMLNRYGITVDEAENGEEAVAMFNRPDVSYDLILMDVQMPKMNGLDATRQIRALGTDRAKTIPIIALTASAYQEDIDACLAAGMNDHISKPLDFDLLIEKVFAITSH